MNAPTPSETTGTRTSVDTLCPYTLPDLPMGTDCWEPWCSTEIVELHHGKHHAAYVKKANTALEALRGVAPDDALKVSALQRTLAFNAAGHVLHSLFWTSLTNETTKPGGALSASIESGLGGLDALKSKMQGAASGLQGSGWVYLASDIEGRLSVGAIHDHHQDLVPHSRLLVVIDLWEHAYYLQYRNEKDSWLKAALAHIDWVHASERFDAIAAS